MGKESRSGFLLGFGNFPGRTVKLWGGNRVSELDSENQGWLDKTILSFLCPEKTTFEGLKLAVKAFFGGASEHLIFGQQKWVLVLVLVFFSLVRNTNKT